MKNRSLLAATLITFSVTGSLLTGAGWFSATRPARAASHHPDTHSHARAQDTMTSEAAWRYRRCQPVHWRALMLQH
jgi:hypothetical protein